MQALTHEEYRRIRTACDEADRRTHAHFAAVVTPVSDRYELFPMVWSAVIALACGGVMAAGWPELTLRMAFGVQAVVFVVLSLAFDWLPIRLFLVPRQFKTLRASRMARREFAARILTHAEHRRGVLFFVSLGERYVEIITAPELHAQIDAAAWQAIIADFIRAVQSGRTADGVVASIEACGSLLGTHCPASAA